MRKFIVFTLGEDEYGIDVGRVIEVLKSFDIRQVPDMPAYIRGVLSVRGDVLPLVDMRIRFELEPMTIKERVILIRTRVGRVGIIVDNVLEILELADSELKPPPEMFRGLRSRYLTGLGKLQDRVIVLLNFDNLLTHEERIRIEQSSSTLSEVS